MAVSSLFGFNERSSLFKVIVVLSIGSTSGGEFPSVLSKVVDNSVVNFSQFFQAEMFPLGEFISLDLNLGSECFFEGFGSRGLALLLLLSLLVLSSDCVILELVSIQLERVVVVGHQLQMTVQLISKSFLLHKKKITPPCLIN